MTDFAPQPIVLREVNGLTVTQSGDMCQTKNAAGKLVGISFFPAADILGNDKHYLRQGLAAVLPRMQSGEIAGIAGADVDGKMVYLLITAVQYALGAPERARYATWHAGILADKQMRDAAERQYDRINNEGGEGYNPHRTGDAPTYRRGRGRYGREG